MPCLQRSVQSRKGGTRCTKEGERLYFLVFLVTYTILWQWPSNTPQMASVPILLYSVHQLIFFYSFPVALVSIPLPKSLSTVCFVVCFVQSTILILWKPVLRMLNCYHIPIYHNRAVPCRVARLLQPCWLGSVRHGFDRVYTSNFNRTVPCRAVAYRAGTEKLSRVNGVLALSG